MNGSKLSHHTRVYVSLLPLKILISRLLFVHCYLPISHLCFKLTFSLFPSLDLLLDPSLPPVPLLNPPLFPLLPSQTNGAYNRLTKNSHAAKSVHFFLSVFFPFQCSYFFFFSLPPSGGKWVTGRRPVSSFIRWQPTCSSLCYWGWAAEAVGPRAGDQAPGCLSGLLLYGHRAWGIEWKWMSRLCLWGVVCTMNITFWSGRGP